MLTVRFDRMGIARGDRVLDLGCGEGRHLHGLHMLGGIEGIGVDLDEVSLERARAGLEHLGPSDASISFLRADAHGLPFPDRSFDALICSEVLEHLADPEAAVREAARLVKPLGSLAISVPRAWPERLCWCLAPGAGGYADQPGGHIRIFEVRALREMIVGHGFHYLGKHHAHGLHTPYWWLQCLVWDRRETHPLVRTYRRFLEWDLLSRPWITRAMEAVATPVIGKSVVLYFRRVA